MNSIAPTHISSLIVRCKPDRLELAMEDTARLDGVEVHQHDQRGVFIVSLETTNEGGILDAIRAIESLSGVINTSLVYHQIEV